MLTLSKVMCNLNNKAITALLKLYDAQKGVRYNLSTGSDGLQMKCHLSVKTNYCFRNIKSKCCLNFLGSVGFAIRCKIRHTG